MLIGGNVHKLKYRKAAYLASLVVCVMITAATQAGATKTSAFAGAAGEAEKSMVLVRARLELPGNEGQSKWIHNTGFYIREGGHVLTNAWAISGATRIELLTPSGDRAPAKVKAVHQSTGLVLLRTKMDKRPLSMTDLVPRAGDWIVLASVHSASRQSVELSLRPSILSSTQASTRCYGLRQEGLMAFAVRCSTGTASAPVLSNKGKLVGVVLSMYKTKGGGDCCYAIPAARLQPIIERLLRGESERAGWLGLAVCHAVGEEGLQVTGVLEGSPGYQSGLRPGDRVIAIDGKTITRPEIFASSIIKAEPGQEVKLQVQREEQVREFTIEVGQRPLRISRASPSSGCPWGKKPDATLKTTEKLQRLQKANREMQALLQQLQDDLEEVKRKVGTPEGNAD